MDHHWAALLWASCYRLLCFPSVGTCVLLLRQQLCHRRLERSFRKVNTNGSGPALTGRVPTSTKDVKENAMNNQIRPYESLTSQNAALVLVDHQVGLMTGVRDISTGESVGNLAGATGL